ncbi:tubby -like protein [Brachionus plicatilis]|uniref:Tubby-like protein n=1 Tax=Brachionus plicatilis TaxID=10195 RepID=A0A3M7RUE7_BRAPC|nr:tubby -like protein [Brachionus plicatilis]
MTELNKSVVSGRNLIFADRNGLVNLDTEFARPDDTNFLDYHSSSDDEDHRANTTINESFLIKRKEKKFYGAASKFDKNSLSIPSDNLLSNGARLNINSVTLDHSKDYSSSEGDLSPSLPKYPTDSNNTDESSRILVAPNDAAPTFDQNDQTPQIDLKMFDLLDKTSKKFVLQPATIGLSIKCQIFRFKGLYPEYKFYLENIDGNLLLLMTARKKKKTKTNCYIINYISFDLDDIEKYIETPLAKLKSNLFGTQFKLYDFGIKPMNDIPPQSYFLKASPNDLEFSETTSEDAQNLDANLSRREYASVTYGFNVLGLKGPRSMNVVIPGMDDKYCREEFILKFKSESLLSCWKRIEENLRADPNEKQANLKNRIRRSIFQLNKKSEKRSSNKEVESEENSMRTSNSKLDAYSNTASSQASNSKSNLRNVVKLINKSPQWNSGLNSFALNFYGRVTISSVKNYQIIHEVNPDYVVTQFGKVNKDLYTCDFSYPFCALQAFGVALSSLDNKIGCD